jgi:hypothetical protein
MSEDRPLKSSFELAMERLRQKDAAEGVVERPLSDRQKAAVAEVRNFYESKLAEQQVLYQDKLKRTMDPGERAALENESRLDRERLASERDRKIQSIRDGA